MTELTCLKRKQASTTMKFDKEQAHRLHALSCINSN